LIIKELNLYHFGKFHHQQIQLRPNTNIIYGENEAGKSTIHAFIQCMLFGTERMRGRGAGRDMYAKYQPWIDGKNYEGAMIIEHEGVTYRLYRSFYKDDEVFQVTNQDTGKAINLGSEGIGSLIENLTESSYKNTISIRRPQMRPDESFSLSLQNYIANLSMTGSDAIQIEEALKELKKQRKQYDPNTIGQDMRQLAEDIHRLNAREKDKQQYVSNLRQISKEEEALKHQIRRMSDKQQQQERESQQEHMRAVKVQERLKAFLIVFALLFLAASGGYFLTGAGQIILLFLSAISGLALMIGSIAFWRNRSTGELRKSSDGLKEENLWAQKEAGTRNKNRLEWELEQLNEEIARIVPLKEQYHLYEEELEKSSKEVDAIDVAVKTIKELASDIHESFGSSLNASVAEMFSEITGKSSQQIYIDEKLNISVDNTKKYISYHHLSAGTIDQLYFSLRFIIGNIIFDGKEMPIILDDVFSLYDDNRLKNILNWLINRQCPQIIIFTCHQREADILDDLGEDYNYIELSIRK